MVYISTLRAFSLFFLPIRAVSLANFESERKRERERGEALRDVDSSFCFSLAFKCLARNESETMESGDKRQQETEFQDSRVSFR